MATPLQSNPSIPFHREFEAAWNKLREGRPWIPEMHIEADAHERLEQLRDEMKKLSEMEGNEPIRCSRMHFAEWARILSDACDHIATFARQSDID